MIDNIPNESIVGQAFIDAISRHNGRDQQKVSTNPRPRKALSTDEQDTQLKKVGVLLEQLDPGMGYKDWLGVAMAVYGETDGSDDGFKLFDSWSSQASSYGGEESIIPMWNTFSGYSVIQVTIGTLIKMVQDKGIDVQALLESVEPDFEVCEGEVIYSEEQNDQKPDGSDNPVSQKDVIFKEFTLKGQSRKLEDEAKVQVHVLDGIALSGQATNLYAKANSGKTLLVLKLLIESIKNQTVDGDLVFYINADDNHSGLIEKSKLAEKHNFHMLGDGYCGFKAEEFPLHLQEIIDRDQAHGVVIILDTLKKFTDLMDKRKSSTFMKAIRRFVSKGGTVVTLAHVNKNLGANGKPVFAGTTDSLDDADCAYLIDVIGDENSIRTIELTNIKRRGNVRNRAGFSYSVRDGLSYQELLDSFQSLDQQSVESTKQHEMVKNDSEIIEAVTACLRETEYQKMALRDAVSLKCNISRKDALEVIERYTGSDSAVHRWNYKTGERGAKEFYLLEGNDDE